MGHSFVEERPCAPGANAARCTPPDCVPSERVPSKAAGNRLLPPPRSSRPLPVVRSVTAAPPATLPPPAGPTQTTAIAKPPPPPSLALAASTGRKSDADVTQVVAPLPPPPVAPPARVARVRPPSPRVIAEPAAEPTTAQTPTAEAPDDASSLTKGTPWAEIKNGKVTYRLIDLPDRDLPKVPDHRAARLPPAGAPGTAALDRRIRLRTAAIGAAALVAAILVVAIGFSSDELPPARAATDLDRALPPDPPPSPSPASPPEEPRAAEATPPGPRPRSPATSSSRTRTTRESGHAKPAGHAHARSAPPITYDADALFLDQR
jgi:hypothetical protein